MKPFKTYYGGKEAAGTYQTIINHIPPHEYFLEAFGGNFAISRKLKCDSLKIVNELSKKVFSKYPESTASIIFTNHDYQVFISQALRCYPCTGLVIYLDPPYLLASKKSDRLVYDCEFGTAEVHTEMLSMANILKDETKIIISHYPHPLYFEKLKGWNYTEFESQTRNGKATEGLWWNYEITDLADYSYLGKDRTDRQRIKRRARLLKNKIKSLPHLEKQALLKSISEIE